MFVDACAIVSMMAGEDTADGYDAALLNAPVPSPRLWSLGGANHARAELLFDSILAKGTRLPRQRRYAARQGSNKIAIPQHPL